MFRHLCTHCTLDVLNRTRRQNYNNLAQDGWQIYTLIFLDRQRAHASCDRLRRRGSGPASPSPSVFALRFLVGTGSAGGVGSGKDGGAPCTAGMSGWCVNTCVITGNDAADDGDDGDEYGVRQQGSQAPKCVFTLRVRTLNPSLRQLPGTDKGSTGSNEIAGIGTSIHYSHTTLL